MVLWRQFSNPSSPLVRAIRAYRQLGPLRRDQDHFTRPPRSRTVHRLRQDQIESLIQRYQAGATVYELGQQFGISRKTVSAHLVRAGVARRYRLLDEETVAAASQLYLDGWSLARIAEHFTVSPNTIHTALRQAGVPMRDSQGRPRV